MVDGHDWFYCVPEDHEQRSKASRRRQAPTRVVVDGIREREREKRRKGKEI